MEEIEVKILEVNRPKIEKILEALGAEKVFDGEVETAFFDFKDARIGKAKNVLRLRQENDKAELTYKKIQFTQTAKTAQEYTVEVSNLETAKKILGSLELFETQNMKKHRVSYTLDDARFDFDRYEGAYGYIPEFLEIEAKSAEAIYRYAGLLGFEEKDCLPWSTTELLGHYSSK